MTAPPDPFDVAVLRKLAPTAPTTTTEIFTVSVHKPRRDSFIRVNPDPEYRLDWPLYEYKHDSKSTWYFISPEMRNEVPNSCPVRLLTVIGKDGVVFIWPAKLPTDDGPGTSWHRSGLAVAEQAETTWVRVQSNRPANAYEAVIALNDLGEPAWPTMTFGELLTKAFTDYTIDSFDHEILRELRGEI